MKIGKIALVALGGTLVLGACGDISGPRVPRTETGPKTSNPGSTTQLQLQVVDAAVRLA